MADLDYITPDSLRGLTHLEDLLEIFNDRFSNIELDRVLVYLIDNVSEQAIPYLADQFGVYEDFGWSLAKTTEQQRELVKTAIKVKRYIGTIYALQEALKAVGYAGADIVEGDGSVGDGKDWARFRITTDLGNEAGLDGETPALLTDLINKVKNARSELLDISYIVSMSEIYSGGMDEVLSIIFESAPLEDEVPLPGLKLDGSWKLDGSYKLSANSEDVKMTIV